MVDFIIAVVIIIIMGGAIGYVCYAKKRGQTCIGCPYAKTCNKDTCGNCDENI